MDLSKLLPWKWFRQPGPAPASEGLRIVRAQEDGEQWPDPDSPECISYELDRLFDHAFSGFGFSAPHLQTACGQATPCVSPRTRLHSDKDAHIFEADLPGVREQDISLTLRGRKLTLLAPRLADRSPGRDAGRAAYRATFALPPDADPDASEASFRGGVLLLRLPRLLAPPSGPRP